MENKITKTDNTLIADNTYKQLLSKLGQVIAEGRKQVLKAVNTTRIYLRRTASEQQAVVDEVITW